MSTCSTCGCTVGYDCSCTVLAVCTCCGAELTAAEIAEHDAAGVFCSDCSGVAQLAERRALIPKASGSNPDTRSIQPDQHAPQPSGDDDGS